MIFFDNLVDIMLKIICASLFIVQKLRYRENRLNKEDPGFYEICYTVTSTSKNELSSFGKFHKIASIFVQYTTL